MRAKTAIIMVLMLAVLPLNGLCLDVSVQVDRNRLTENESLLMKVVVDDDDAVVDTSPIRDFKVMPRGTSTSVSIINGSYSKSVTHNYLLMPLKEGSLIIPPLTVSAGKEKKQSDPITILVTAKSDEAGETGDLFARASLSSTRMVVGQQAIYTFQLFSAVRFGNARLQSPKFDGFTAQEAGERKNYTRVINGRAYDVTEIQYVVVPQTPGGFSIEPSVLMCDIPAGGGHDPFGDSLFGSRLFSMGRTRTVQVKTEGFEVAVKALPNFEGKGRYSGLVGTFSIGAGIDKSTLKVGESVTLTLTVSGTGNVMDAEAPPVELPDTFKVYDDSPEQTVSVTQAGYTGEKIFKKALVPTQAGRFDIPPVELVYFDSGQGRYEAVSTPAIPMTVLEAAPETLTVDTPKSQASQPPGVTKKNVEVTGHDILALKQGAGVLLPTREIPFAWFGSLIMLPFFLFPGIRFFVRRGKRQLSVSAMMQTRAGESLKKAREPELTQEMFLKHLYRALVSVVLAKGGVQGETLTARETAGILSDAGCDDDVTQQVVMALDDIEKARYSREIPGSEHRDALLGRVTDLVKKLTVVLVLVSVLCVAPGHLMADDTGTRFLRGVHAYDAGEFEKAAKLFEAVAEAGINTGDLYYNIGNAWLKAGNTGKAVLWYERARKLIPLDPDLRFNLNYAETFVKDKTESSGLDVISLIFFWKDYLSAQTLQQAALAVCYLFFIYALFRTLKKKRVFTLAGVVAAVVSVLIITTAFYDYYQHGTESRAVIISPEVPVRSGLSQESTELFVLHAGTRVTVEDQQDGYLKISFTKGKIGWVRVGDAEVI